MFYEYYDINCDANLNCYLTENLIHNQQHIMYIVMAIIAATGFFGNLFSYFIFSRSREQANKKFRELLKLFVFNSFLYCSNDLALCLFWLTSTKAIYENKEYIYHLYHSYEMVFYYSFIRNNIASLSYAFGSLLDIYLTWGRIQIFKPNYKFLLNTPVRKLFFWFLLIGLLLAIPIGISREVLKIEYNIIDTNTTAVVYTNGFARRFGGSRAFEYLVFSTNIIRDVFTMIIEIILNIMLVYLFSRYVIQKVSVTGRQNDSLSKAERNNMIMTFILSIISTLVHISYFMVFISRTFRLPHEIVIELQSFAGFFGIVRHSINILIFYAINAEFRKGIKNLFNGNSSTGNSTSYSNSTQSVNLQSRSTLKNTILNDNN